MFSAHCRVHFTENSCSESSHGVEDTLFLWSRKRICGLLGGVFRKPLDPVAAPEVKEPEFPEEDAAVPGLGVTANLNSAAFNPVQGVRTLTIPAFQAFALLVASLVKPGQCESKACSLLVPPTGSRLWCFAILVPHTLSRHLLHTPAFRVTWGM